MITKKHILVDPRASDVKVGRVVEMQICGQNKKTPSFLWFKRGPEDEKAWSNSVNEFRDGAIHGFKHLARQKRKENDLLARIKALETQIGLNNEDIKKLLVELRTEQSKKIDNYNSSKTLVEMLKKLGCTVESVKNPDGSEILLITSPDKKDLGSLPGFGIN